MKRDKQERDILLSMADDLYAWISAHTEDMARAAEELAPLAWFSEFAHREEHDGGIYEWNVLQFQGGGGMGVLMFADLERSGMVVHSRETHRCSGNACAGMDIAAQKAAAWLRHPRLMEDVEMAIRRAVPHPERSASLILRDRDGYTYVIEATHRHRGSSRLRLAVTPGWCEWLCFESTGAVWGEKHHWEKQQLSRCSVPSGYEVVYRRE